MLVVIVFLSLLFINVDHQQKSLAASTNRLVLTNAEKYAYENGGILTMQAAGNSSYMVPSIPGYEVQTTVQSAESAYKIVHGASGEFQITVSVPIVIEFPDRTETGRLLLRVRPQ
ncbi:MAG: hypothetical protein V1911_02205 [Candidatus Micrarchaeota archaeon]